MLTGQQVQRLGSHIAAVRPHLLAILRDFSRRLTAAFPAAASALPVDDRSARFDMAEAIALVCKNLHDLAPLAPFLRHAGRSIAARGLDVSAAPVAAAAMLAALRHASAANWSRDIEADYRQLLDFVTAEMARGAASAARPARPAQLAA